MGRKIERLTLDHLDQLGGGCGSCVFWELDPVSNANAMRKAKEDDWIRMIAMNKYAHAASGEPAATRMPSSGITWIPSSYSGYAPATINRRLAAIKSLVAFARKLAGEAAGVTAGAPARRGLFGRQKKQ